MNGSQPIPIGEYEQQSPVENVEVGGRLLRYATPNQATQWRVRTLFTKEPSTIEWLGSIPRGSRLLDVGANVGMYAIYAARVRDCRVYAFEPESQNYALLNRNIHLNGLSDSVTAWCAALSDREGIDLLHLSDFAAGASCHSVGEEVDFNLQPRRPAFRQGAVCLTLDRLVSSGALPVPEFIKIDVDGFEHLVIEGAANTLRDPAVRSVIVELNPKIEAHVHLISRLQDLGFSFDPDQVRRATRASGPFAGVAEHVFRRDPPPWIQGARQAGAIAANAAEAAVCASIAAAPMLRDPFEHCIIDEIFPQELLAEIHRHWPDESEFRPIEESGRVTVTLERRGRRKVVFLTQAGCAHLEAQRRAFWQDALWRWLSGPRVRQVLLNKFRDLLAPRLAGGATIVADGLTVSDRTRYAIGPHTDSPRRLVSLLFYLPLDDSLARFGTSFYRPRRAGFTSTGGPHLPFEDFERVTTVGFLPNRLVMFPKTDRCFHGVEPIEQESVERRLLIFDLQIAGTPTERGDGPAYSRAHPSPRYHVLIEQYRHMHREGERFLNIAPDATFPGFSLLTHLAAVKQLVRKTGARELLDYGSGKGEQYRPRHVAVPGEVGSWGGVAEYWDVDNVHCYDPCHEPFSQLPDGQFDGVISTDVLEHCPEEDVPWILDEIFAYARRFVFLTIAGYQARKRLPNGENAHSTIRPPDWWRARIEAAASRRPGVEWRARFYGPEGGAEFVELG